MKRGVEDCEPREKKKTAKRSPCDCDGDGEEGDVLVNGPLGHSFGRSDKYKTENLEKRRGQREHDSWHPGLVTTKEDNAVVARKTWWRCRACDVEVGIVRCATCTRVLFRTPNKLVHTVREEAKALGTLLSRFQAPRKLN